MSHKGQKLDFAFFSGNSLLAHQNERDSDILQLILNSIPQYVFWKDRNSVYQGCNRKFGDAAGMKRPEDICGLTDHDLPWTREEADFYRLCDQRVMDNNQAEYDIIESQVQADGLQYWLKTNKLPLHNKNGDVIGILGAYDDVTDLVKKEQQLKLYEIITATVDDLMAIVGTDYHYQAANEAYCAAFALKREAIIGAHVSSVVGSKSFEQTIKPGMDRAFAGTVVRFDSFQTFPGAGDKHINCTYYPVHDESGTLITSIVAKIQDTTKTKRLEHELQQVQKMEAIGRLAGGIAHDFNNILSVINGYSDICLHQMEEDNPYRAKIEQIHQAGVRATRLTQQLLGFSRKQIVQPFSLDLAEEISGLAHMLSRLLGASIEIETNIAPDPWLIKLDRSQFEQIILNLAVNARDAMTDGGKLSVEIANHSLGSAEEMDQYGLEAGDYVVLVFRDTGSGMDAMTQSRIFEPFFTTKPKEIGTGFGLSTVYGIVKQNSGHITVESEPGTGTTFRLFFPRANDNDGEAALSPPRSETLSRGSGTILLAEDDHALRTMCVGILADLGYTILEASNGKEAIEAANRYHDRIDLFLTDVVMPEMSGPEAAAILGGQFEDLKILFMSGYAEHAIAHHGIPDSGIEFIHKPITPKTLSKAVSRCLADPAKKKS
jgi:PAS domain S-box-containing protein